LRDALFDNWRLMLSLLVPFHMGLSPLTFSDAVREGCQHASTHRERSASHLGASHVSVRPSEAIVLERHQLTPSRARLSPEEPCSLRREGLPQAGRMDHAWALPPEAF